MAVENLERHFALRRRLEVIGDQRSLFRILSHGLPAFEFFRPVHSIRWCGLVEKDIRSCGLRQLPKRIEVIQNPERPPVSRHYQIIILDHKVVDWRNRQVELERPPVRSTVERDEYARLRSCIEQGLLRGIFTHGMNVSSVRDAVGEHGPTFAEIGRLVDVWLEIVELVAIERNVGCTCVVRRGFDQADQAPLRHTFWSDVGPRLAAVARDMHEAVIGPNPE